MSGSLVAEPDKQRDGPSRLGIDKLSPFPVRAGVNRTTTPSKSRRPSIRSSPSCTRSEVEAHDSDSSMRQDPLSGICTLPGPFEKVCSTTSSPLPSSAWRVTERRFRWPVADGLVPMQLRVGNSYCHHAAPSLRIYEQPKHHRCLSSGYSIIAGRALRATRALRAGRPRKFRWALLASLISSRNFLA